MTNIQIQIGKHEFSFHQGLYNNVAYCKRNQKKDWDFKQLISGDGMTRTGKSTIAFQLALIQDECFADNWRNQVVFNGEDLIKIAYSLGEGKVIVYDEAREGLDSKRQMESYVKNLLDFFSQCGKLNHILIIVCPEFFELPKSIAITQSIFLINCYARDGFERGYFDFFNRKDKKYLYINGQKYLDYKSQNPSFKGTFTNYIPFDREEYEKLKIEALTKQQARKKKELQTSEFHLRIIKNTIENLLLKGFTKIEISNILGVARKTIYNLIQEMKGLEIKETEEGFEDIQNHEESVVYNTNKEMCMSNVYNNNDTNGNEKIKNQNLEKERTQQCNKNNDDLLKESLEQKREGDTY